MYGIMLFSCVQDLQDFAKKYCTVNNNKGRQ